MNETLFFNRARQHPRPSSTHVYSYGTAGFRCSADLLDSVAFRVGILAGLRSRKMGGKMIGVMITASHNVETDNGMKIVDPHGEMMNTSWESLATQLANYRTDRELSTGISSLIQSEQIDYHQNDVEPKVIWGYDTRPSCPKLAQALIEGLETCNVQQHQSAGLVTTPQLHYLVRCFNTFGTKESYGEPSLKGYYEKFSKAYTSLAIGRRLLPALTVDCANGVGYHSLLSFLPIITSSILPLNLVKTDTTTKGALNHNCGADYVKTSQSSPPGIEMIQGQRYCSFDGDADRIVYYFKDLKGHFRLLDGDKIATLVAKFLIHLIEKLGLKKEEEKIQVGVVQTAYANGASTTYLKEKLKVPVTCTPTGVKYLHHAAEAYDIGIYFEANGHGTVLFSPKTLAKIRSLASSSSSSSSPSFNKSSDHEEEKIEQQQQRTTIQTLLALTELINQTVGDALSDLLLVETILIHSQSNVFEWDSNYIDLPNRLEKILVKDPTLFKTIDSERKLIEPVGLQRKIDGIVESFEKGRSFVRPSGTEDCVRVYAEAATRELADELAREISKLVSDLYGKK